jgi:hypothetical protein
VHIEQKDDIGAYFEKATEFVLTLEETNEQQRAVPMNCDVFVSGSA